jgi:hypothetical protein
MLTARGTDVPAANSSITVQEARAGVIVRTGSATFHLGHTRLPLDRVVIGSHDVLDADGSEIVLTDGSGRQCQPSVQRLRVEARGPVRATVSYEGTFTRGLGIRFLARVSFFAETNLVRVQLTIHNPRRARHRGGLWDLGDPNALSFRDLSLAIQPKRANTPDVAWTVEPGQPLREAAEGSLEIFQASSGGANWNSRNHVNRHGTVPMPFCGYRIRAGRTEALGRRANPVVAMRAEHGWLTAAMPEFWQQFPKSIAVNEGRLRLGLFPHEFGDTFELQGGEQKTHTVWLHFGDADGLGWVHQPACVHAAPEWYQDSGALPYFTSPTPPSHIDDFLGGAVRGSDSLVARRETIDDYGWRHFGDIYADHEAAYYKGSAPIISHYNNQYDMVYGALVQFLRTGDPAWVEVFAPLARHVIDIDIYHTDRDKAAYNGGLFWHTDHYRDAATCTHRAYSSANQPAGRPYGGGPCDEHNYTSGLLHYYYLTGEPTARDAVLSLADWVIHMDDGRRNVLGLLDDGPTGNASSTSQPDYHGAGRGAGNSVNALLDGWLISGARRYLDKAEELIRRCIHPRDDIAARDLLNAELRWSYTVFLTVLARYLHLKADVGAVDFMYAYARASLLHYAGWMVENEVPYFDHPEKLEFQTETWAAQELRKANVLRLASTHADAPLCTRLLERADALVERGWADLLGFERPATTRALAILLAEGFKDGFFRTQTTRRAPRPIAEYDFGSPACFVPQRQRVMTRLRSVRAMLGAVLAMARPKTWRAASRLARGVFPEAGQESKTP